MLRFLRKKMKVIIAIVAIMFAGSILYGVGSIRLKGDGEEGIGKIDGKKIDEKSFANELDRVFRQQQDKLGITEVIYLQGIVLSQLIERTILLKEAKKHVRVGGAEIDAAIAQIMESNKISSKVDFLRGIKRMGFTEKRFKELLKEDIMLQKMAAKIREGVTISDKDLREVRARHILIRPKDKSEEAEADAKAKIERILARVEKGEELAALAKKYSEDPSNRKQGGNLGYFGAGIMVPEFERVAFSLKAGEVSKVVKSPFGYHIIKVEETRIKEPKEKGEDVKKRVLEEKRERTYRQWIAETKNRAKVEIYNKVFKGMLAEQRGDMRTAMLNYQTAITENPANPYAHILLGKSYKFSGNLPGAIQEYEEAIDILPAETDLYLLLGRTYLETDSVAQATQQFKKASLIAGDNLEIHEKLLKAFEELKLVAEVKREKMEIARIKKKQEFEEEIRQRTSN